MQKFNIGDKVKVSKLDNRTWVEVRKRLGQIGTVIKPDPTDCQIEFEDGKRFFFYYCELEKVEEDFKIGDKVRIISSTPFLERTHQIGKIIEIVGVKTFKISFYDGACYNFIADEIEKVEDFDNQFKIGEEAYINGHGFINEKVLVYNVSEHSISVKTKSDLIYYFDPKFISKQPINPKSDKQVEKIMNKTPEQIDSEIIGLKAQIAKLEKEKENSTFEVGDWFKVDENSSCGDFKRGCFYEIVKIDKESYTTMLTPRFNESGDGKNNRYNSKFAIKATPAEIEAHLIKLAEESGLKIGEEARGTINYLAPKQRTIVKFKLYSSETKNSNSIGCNGYLEKNELKYGLAVCYNNGFCSYPFDYIIYLQNKFQPKITINGYDAEFHSGFVSFGCAKFSNGVFVETKKFINKISYCESNSSLTNRHVENIKLGAGIFTPTDIENIVKRLKD